MNNFLVAWNTQNLFYITTLIRSINNKTELERIGGFITEYKYLEPSSNKGRVFVLKVLEIFLKHSDLYGYKYDIFNLNKFVSWKGILTFLKHNKPKYYYNQIDYYGFTPLLDCARYGDFNTFLYLLDKTDVNNYFIYGNNQNTFNIFSCSIYNKDLRIFEYIFNNKKLVELFSPLFGSPTYNNPTPKQNYCCNLIYSWIGNNNNNSKNIYKKMCKLQEIIGSTTFINPILPLIPVDILCKCIRKFYDVIDITHIRFTIAKETTVIKLLFNIYKSTDDFRSMINLYKYSVTNYKYNKLIANEIYYCCGTYITNSNYIEIIIYLIKNNSKSNLNYLQELFMFFYSKLDFNISPVYILDNRTDYYGYQVIHYIYLCGLNRLIKVNDYVKKNDYNKVICKWENTLKLLRRVCKRTVNFIEYDYSKTLKNIIHIYTNSNKTLINSNACNSTLKNIAGLSNTIYITEKADGIKTDLKVNNCYPSIDYFDIMDVFNLDSIKCEQLIINNTTVYIVIESFAVNNYLRKQHPYVKDLTTDFSFDDKLYERTEVESFKNYINQNKHKSKCLWWPKIVWSISKTDLYNDFINIKNLSYSIFETDGWILLDGDNIIKLKPDSHITLDLLFMNNSFYYHNSIKFKNIYNSKSLTNNTIVNGVYRCYYNKINQIWYIGEERLDKVLPNNRFIVEEIENYFKHGWTIEDILVFDDIPKYYEQNDFSFVDRNITYLNRLICKICYKKDILDIGCGFSSNKTKRITGCNKYHGFDCDISMMENTNEFSLVDINDNWTKYTNKQNIYLSNIDVVLMLNTIHYCTDHNKLIQNLSQVCKSGTTIVIKFLNKRLLNKIISNNNIIASGSNFVKFINETQIKYYYSGRFIKPKIEFVLSDLEIIKLFTKNGWKLQEQQDFLTNTQCIWDNYIDCFSILVLKYLN